MSAPTETPFDPTTFPSLASTSLADLQTALNPLLREKWEDKLEGMAPLQRAKMDVMMAYTIVDLAWIYLKMKGVDPATHEVSAELERVRKYYAKIKDMEAPETRKFKVDGPAAGRFIQHGIPKSQRLGAGAGAGDSSADLPESSASGAAAAGRQRAAKEQAEEAERESLGRVGKMGRMRFIAADQDGVERIVPGPAGSGLSGGDVEMNGDGEDVAHSSGFNGGNGEDGGVGEEEEEEEEEEVEEEIEETEDVGDESDGLSEQARACDKDGVVGEDGGSADQLPEIISTDLGRAKRKRAEEW